MNNAQIDISNLFDNNFDSVMHYSDEEHLFLIENIKNSLILHNPLSDTQKKNFAQYFISVPDAAALYMFDIFPNEATQENLKQIWALVIDGKTVGKRLSDICTNEQRRQAAINIVRNVGLWKN